jgi:uncharacterized protein (TIGR03032 family)
VSNETGIVDKRIEPSLGTTKKDNVKFSKSAGFSKILSSMGASIAFTSYQSNILYLIGTKSDGGTNVHQSPVQRPMGLCVNREGEFHLAAGHQLIRFADALNSGEVANGMFDACYVARTVHYTGPLDAHDIGMDQNGQPIFVNTRFNCIAALDDRHAFREVWRPSFISALVAEDRCHLNGMAMMDGAPAYVTAVSRSDTIDGWRDRRDGGGVVIDVRSNEIVCEGLSMPHSPRLHDGQLYVLNSGTGEFGRVAGLEDGKGRFEPIAFCPGFTRGLALHDNYAFVGLSRPRYERFEGLPLDQRLRDVDSSAWTGVQVIDINTGACVDWFRMDGPIMEIFDVAVMKDRCPMAISPDAKEIKTFAARPA